MTVEAGPSGARWRRILLGGLALSSWIVGCTSSSDPESEVVGSAGTEESLPIIVDSLPEAPEDEYPCAQLDQAEEAFGELTPLPTACESPSRSSVAEVLKAVAVTPSTLILAVPSGYRAESDGLIKQDGVFIGMRRGVQEEELVLRSVDSLVLCSFVPDEYDSTYSCFLTDSVATHD